MRDYARFKTSSREKPLLSRRMILLVLGVFLVVASAILYKTPGTAVVKNTPVAASGKKKAAPAVAATPVDPASQVKFDFYTMLPKLQVAPAATDALQKPQSGQFVDQAGIFGDKKLADALVSSLQLKGFNPQIITVSPSDTGGSAKYRVVLGPFATKEEAVTAQKNLKLANVWSVVRQEA